MGKKLGLLCLCMMLCLPGVGLATTTTTNNNVTIVNGLEMIETNIGAGNLENQIGQVAPNSNTTASGEDEPKRPTISSTIISHSTARVGDTVTITATVDSPDYKINRVEAFLYNHEIELAYNSNTGTWIGTYQIQEYDHQGNWYLNFRLHGEYSWWKHDTLQFVSVINPNEDRVLPEVTFIGLDPQTIEAGKAFTISVKATDQYGIKTARVDFVRLDGSTRVGKQLTYDNVRGEWTASYLFEKNMEPGEWKVQIRVKDRATNELTVMKEFELVNSEYDIIPPAADQITLSKQSATYGENIHLTAKITDNKTGVKSAALRLCDEKYNCYTWNLQKNGSTGLWEVTFWIDAYIKPGMYTVTIHMYDNADNNIHQTTTHNVEVIDDKSPPAKPLIYDVTNRSKAIGGVTEPFAVVKIKIGTTGTQQISADENGFFLMSIPLQPAGTKITVTAMDIRGNVSFPATITVKDVIPPAVPVVNAVTNKATLITGKTEKSITVSTKIGTKTYTSKSDTYGNYKIIIPVQNAGTKIAVSAKDVAGNISPARTISVTKIAPNVPVTNTVTNKSNAVIGKTEAYATIYVKIGSKTYSSKANSKGSFKVSIPVSNYGTVLSITAKDRSGRISYPGKATVLRVAPNIPTVNSVRYYSTTVTGKTEKNATVTAKIGSRTYSAKANAYGNFSIKIPKQRKGTTIYVNAKDSKGLISTTRSIKVY
ncbi:Ig-like domain-containing protein [Bacillus sp. EB01]|uniref:Ig-like domain-containing protein n=1 Tax=Bacillus sp. EB01 TaxID=1347086 RepID=UPI0005C5257A|nr:Ig-like domain-containing protein [Bacillus sp. EB01]